MRFSHNPLIRVQLDLLRAFFAIAELGSLNRAAERLRVSQSTLTRQMQTLEREVGGQLLERSASGVALTPTGRALLDGAQPALAKFDTVLADVRKLARGQSTSLRIGYLMSAAPEYLHPALTQLRREHPEIKVKLLDLSPGEQIAALRAGTVDLALLGHAGVFVQREFYVRRLATLPVLVALPEAHPLAARKKIPLASLRGEAFIGAAETDMPGNNRWIAQLCRRAGFKPAFLEDAASLAQALATIVTENAVTLVPDYARSLRAPGVAFRPVADAGVTWDLMVAWQRGRLSAPVKAMLAAWPAAASSSAG